MPNWCHNTLEVSGEEAEVFDWVRRVREPGEGENTDGTPLFFSSLLPEPDYDDSGDDKVMPDWYNWRITHWGTKWEPSFSPVQQTLNGEVTEGHPDVRRWKGGVSYQFDTAWGPPLEWLEKAAEMFPGLKMTLTYGEPGMEFGGRVTLRGEELLVSEEGTAEEFLESDQMWF